MKDQTIEHLLSNLEIHISNNQNAKSNSQHEGIFERKRNIGMIKEEIKRRCSDDK